jgi:hypothetical protein
MKLAALAIGPLVTSCVAGCAAPYAEFTDLKTPGVTCWGGLHFDEAAGCTRETARGDAVVRVRCSSEGAPPAAVVGALYAIDGQTLYGWREAPPAKPGATGPVLYTSVPPGQHALLVRFKYAPRSSAGSVAENATSTTFTARAGSVTEMTAVHVVVVETEKGTATPPVERSGVRWVGGQ